jgi:hypothetical protein
MAMDFSGKVLLQCTRKWKESMRGVHKREASNPISTSILSCIEQNSMEGGAIESKYQPIGIPVGRELIVAWARGLGVADVGCTLILQCLETEFLLSRPCNFKGYRSNCFPEEAQLRHL